VASFNFDVVVVGASFGGVAAALAASADPKVTVALLEPSNWVGGQATSQGVTRWDEAGVARILTTGSSPSYRGLEERIRAFYRQNATLSAHGNQMVHFNPGAAESNFPFAADPHVVQGILRALIDAQNARLTLKLGATVIGVAVQNGLVQSLTVRAGNSTDTYTGKMYVDATDLGDLLPLAGLPWKIGAESQADTGEPDAPAQAHPEWIQPITVPVALERRPDGENHRIPKPANYDDIVRDQGFHVVDGDINGVFTVQPGGSETIWSYRRYIDSRNFADPNYAYDRTTINVGSVDYQKATLPTGDPHQDAAVVEGARQAALAYVYWLQTDVPHDGDPLGTGPKGYPNIMVRTDAFGTADGTAPAAYIRESRRIDGLTRIVRQNIDTAMQPPGATRARLFADSCGIGWYGIDVHPASGIGTPQHNFSTLPFQIPLGALLPKTLRNFIAGCKNIGATHLTSGAYRVHPVEWAIGEAAGVLAAFCTTQQVDSHVVWSDDGRLSSYQFRLVARGIPIFWWDDVVYDNDHQAFEAIHLTGVRGIFHGTGGLNFNPEGSVSQADRTVIDQRVGHSLPWPSNAMNRAQTAIWVCRQLGLPV
jgi:FAD dependent oxidoreductase